MENMQEKESRAFWRRPIVIGVALLLATALAVGACAGSVINPEEQETGESNAAAAESTPVSENQEAAEAEVPQSEPASDNFADYFAPDGDPTEEYKGVSVGLTKNGHPYRGDPDAPVLLIEYSDYQCPFCARHYVETEPSITEQYVDAGLVRAVFIEFPLQQLYPGSPLAHAAALCVLDQGSVANYWNMHATVFTSVDEWGSSSDAGALYEGYATDAGADLAAFKECMDSGDKLEEVDGLVSFAVAQGFGGTPSFQLIRVEDGVTTPLVGAQPFSEFANSIDALLAGETPRDPNAFPFWATAEGWAPDPVRPGYNMAGDQYKGSLDAPVTIVEFSDLQCPYCKQHTLETQSVLDETFVDTGKVLWVFKHLPLSIHPQAPAAAAAAECATAEGKFWEMIYALFERQTDWSVSDPNPVLTEIAEELALDAEAFAACIEDAETMISVNDDLTEGQRVVRATPSFIVLHAGEPFLMEGAVPAEQFVTQIEEVLAASE